MIIKAEAKSKKRQNGGKNDENEERRGGETGGFEQDGGEEAKWQGEDEFERAGEKTQKKSVAFGFDGFGTMN